MKTATLIALVCTGLYLLDLVLHFGFYLLHIQIHLTTHGILGPVLYGLFLASLFYYFLVLCKSQKS
jgi:hypothetical protein